MKRVIVNINLEFIYPDCSSDEEAELMAQDETLPDSYVSESFEIVKVMDE
jgi:hypothetical protein